MGTQQQVREYEEQEKGSVIEVYKTWWEIIYINSSILCWFFLYVFYVELFQKQFKPLSSR